MAGLERAKKRRKKEREGEGGKRERDVEYSKNARLRTRSTRKREGLLANLSVGWRREEYVCVGWRWSGSTAGKHKTDAGNNAHPVVAPRRAEPRAEKSQHGCRVTCTFRSSFFARRRFPGRLIDGSYHVGARVPSLSCNIPTARVPVGRRRYATQGASARHGKYPRGKKSAGDVRKIDSRPAPVC